MGFVTIKEDEQVLIFNQRGQGRLVEGPARIWQAVDEQVDFLRRIVAGQNQYLVVKHRDGNREHIPGPTVMFQNKLLVDSIELQDVTKLDANHLIVVYKQMDGKIERRIVRGPVIFIPSAHEWLHEFVWHGPDPSYPGRFIPQRAKFTELEHLPSEFQVNVKDVRTNDDTLITVKLMLFYQLDDVETMLDQTHDPVADLINAVQSDVVSFASQRSYEEFIKQTNSLNSMETYSQLATRAKRIGYHITKVVYRGYEASDTLQATHDNAVQTRTHIRLNKEAEEKEQVLLQFKLKREKERTKLKQEMERKLQDHQQTLESLRQQSATEEEQLTHEAKLKKEANEVEMQVELEKEENEQKAFFLKKLQSLGVDMTKYMLAIEEDYVPEREIVLGPATKEVSLQQLLSSSSTL